MYSYGTGTYARGPYEYEYGDEYEYEYGDGNSPRQPPLWYSNDARHLWCFQGCSACCSHSEMGFHLGLGSATCEGCCDHELLACRCFPCVSWLGWTRVRLWRGGAIGDQLRLILPISGGHSSNLPMRVLCPSILPIGWGHPSIVPTGGGRS